MAKEMLRAKVMEASKDVITVEAVIELREMFDALIGAVGKAFVFHPSWDRLDDGRWKVVLKFEPASQWIYIEEVTDA